MTYIYWSRFAKYYEYGTVEAINLENQWESLCPGFHQWFAQNRNLCSLKVFIQSARLSADSKGLCYQNDIEYIHAIEKRYQNFKKKRIGLAISNNVRKMIKSVLSMGQAIFACLQNSVNSRRQAMCDTPEVKKERQITNILENTYY